MADFIPMPAIETLPSHVATPHGTEYETIYDNEDGHFEPVPVELTTPSIVLPMKKNEFDVVLFSHIMGIVGCCLFVIASVCFLRKHFPG